MKTRLGLPKATGRAGHVLSIMQTAAGKPGAAWDCTGELERALQTPASRPDPHGHVAPRQGAGGQQQVADAEMCFWSKVPGGT